MIEEDGSNDMDILAVQDESQLAKQKEMAFWYEKEQKRKARLARGQLAADEEKVSEEVNKPIARAAQVAQGTPEDEQEGFGFWASEAGSALAGGARDAVQELVETGSDLAGLEDPAFTLPEINANESGFGQGARSMVQLMTGFIPAIGVVGKAGKVARAVSNGLTKSNKADKVLDGAGGQTVKFAAAGALADGTVIDPHAERIADLFVEMENRDPEAEKSMMEWLASDPTDSKAEGRLKNVIEGLALGGVADGVFKGVKLLRGKYTKAGMEELKVKARTKELEAKAETDLDPNARDIPLDKADEAPVSPAGRETGELDANNKPTHYLDDESNVPKINQRMTDGETPSLAPIEQITSKIVKIGALGSKSVANMTKAIISGDSESVTKAFTDEGVNLRHIDDVEGLRATVDDLTAAMTSKMGEVETQAAVIKLAKSMEMSPEKLKSLHGDTADLGARLAAQHSLNVIQHKEALDLVRAAVDQPTAANTIAANKALEVFGLLRAEIRGTQTQIARGLSHMRIIKGDSDAVAARKLGDLLESQGGTAANQNKFNKIMMLGKELSDEDLDNFVKKSVAGKINSAALELMINSMLSGPQTHVVNALSNFLVSFMGIAERGVAVGRSKIGLAAKDNMQGTGNETLTAGALRSRTMGMFRGVSRAAGITAKGSTAARAALARAASLDFKGAKATIVENKDEFGTMYHSAAKNESIIDPLGKHKTEQGAAEVDAITAENAGLSSKGWLGTVVNVLGTASRMSGRALVTADELFKSVAYTGEMSELIYSKLIRDGVDPSSKEFAERFLALEKNPPQFMQTQSLKRAREDTFTNPLGEKGRNITNAINQIPMARYIIPFVRTPVNILKYAGVRTPVIRRLAKSVNEDIAAGGARADLANAKMNIASVAYLMGTLGAAEGNISGAGGGGTKKSQRAAGWQPYSVKVGDTWYAYDRLDPLSLPLAISASFVEMGSSVSEKEAMARIGDAMIGTLAFAGDKAWFNGLLEITAAVESGNTEGWLRVMKQYPNTFIPLSGTRRAITRSTDKAMMEQYDWLDVIASNTGRTFGLDQVKVDDFGEDRENQDTLGPAWLLPIKKSEISTDKTKQELADLDIQFAKVNRVIGNGKHTTGVKLDKEQYRRFQQLIGKDAKIGGKGFKESLDELIQSKGYQKLFDEDRDFADKHGSLKENRIRKLRTRYKKAAERQLKEEFPSLKQATLDDKYNTRFKLRGIPLPQWLLDARDEDPNNPK